MKRISTLLLLWLAFCATTFAKTNYAIAEGDFNFKQFNFKKAVQYYEKALKHDNDNVYLLQRIADSYRLMNNWMAAEPYYGRLMATGKATPADKLYYAEVLRAEEKYGGAKLYYTQYLETNPNDSSAKESLRGLDQLATLRYDNGLCIIKNQDSINSKFSDFGIALHGSNVIYFSSDRQPKAYVRRTNNWTDGTFVALYQAEVKDTFGNTRNPELIESNSINERFHQSSPNYNAILNELYFDRSNFNGRRALFSDDKTVKLKLYKVAWKGDTKKWNGKLEEAVAFNNKEFSACHPSLNTNGDTLYFASDMPGGYGRVDIYLATRQANGTWSNPINLGAGVNSSGDDMFPFIANNSMLYFASNGHSGLGGLDIYASYNNAGTWTAPVNLGAPINTSADDFGYIVNSDNKSGYFASNRAGGKGDDDIYSFAIHGITLKGITYNAFTNALIPDATIAVTPTNVGPILNTGPEGQFSCNAVANTNYTFTTTKEGYYPSTVSYRLAAASGFVRIPMYPAGNIQLEVTVIDKKTHNPIDSAIVTIANSNHTNPQQFWTNKDGQCNIAVDSAKQYSLEASKANYLNASANVSTVGVQPPTTLKHTLELNKTNGPIVLENIYYDLDQWFVRPDAALILDRLVKILKDNPSISIELGSHTDCRETENYNTVLSQKRAQSAVDYIATKGISINRMTAVGYGESKIINNCYCEGSSVSMCSEEEHQQNRRTEFKVAKKLLANETVK